MKGLFLIPKIQGPDATPGRYQLHLSKLLEERMGFEVRVTDSSDGIAPDTDVVITFKAPQHSNPTMYYNLLNLSRRTKLIGWYIDLQSYGRWMGDSYTRHMQKRLSRDDVILSSFDTPFREMWPGFVDKLVHFPLFFSPQKAFTELEFNNSPKMKCLLTGKSTGHYPLRAHVRAYADPKKLELGPPHPGYALKGLPEDACIDEKYAELINGYFCAVTCSSSYDCVIAKYFEIPAAGALLLAKDSPDLENLGFIPGWNFIPVTMNSVLRIIDDCLAHPERYDDIRRRGMEFVRAKHGIENRFEQLKGVLEAL